MRRFEDKVAIVTGAGTGIGEAIAHKLAKEGAKVVANSLPYDFLDDVVAAIKDYGGEATAYCGDVSEEKEALKCVQSAIDKYGKLDILINNAGVHQKKWQMSVPLLPRMKQAMLRELYGWRMVVSP